MAEPRPAATTPVDPTRCPICGDDNRCGAERGAGSCWCHAVRIPESVLDKVPPAARNVACVCERCAFERRADG
ncbi:MAG: cysteine-rich CWC family protein [Vicinamibacterales bacterium]